MSRSHNDDETPSGPPPGLSISTPDSAASSDEALHVLPAAEESALISAAEESAHISKKQRIELEASKTSKPPSKKRGLLIIDIDGTTLTGNIFDDLNDKYPEWSRLNLLHQLDQLKTQVALDRTLIGNPAGWKQRLESLAEDFDIAFISLNKREDTDLVAMALRQKLLDAGVNPDVVTQIYIHCQHTKDKSEGIDAAVAHFNRDPNDLRRIMFDDTEVHMDDAIEAKQLHPLGKTKVKKEGDGSELLADLEKSKVISRMEEIEKLTKTQSAENKFSSSASGPAPMDTSASSASSEIDAPAVPSAPSKSFGFGGRKLFKPAPSSEQPPQVPSAPSSSSGKPSFKFGSGRGGGNPTG